MPWKRTCRRRGGDRGSIEVDAVSEASCLVVLGGPGMGKTTELRRLHDVARDSGRRVSWVDLGELQDAVTIRLEVFDRGPLNRWRDEPTGLDLFLDGLDEALAATRNVAGLLCRELARLGPIEELRIRLGCRSVSWSANTERQLEALWPSGVEVVELEPVSLGVLQGELEQTFVYSLIDAGLASWSRVPLTLKMLHRVWTVDGALPSSRAEVYERALTLLFSEPNELRRRLGLVSEHAPSELEATGELLASVSVLAGRPLLELPRAGAPSWPSANMLTASILRAVPEPGATDRYADTVTTAAFVHLRETTDRHVLTWGHRSWAEFLAARFLARRNIGVDPLRSLFEHPHDPECGVAPPLEETSTWLAALDPAWAAELLARDPIGALQADRELARAERPRLVEALLEAVASGRILHRLRDVYGFRGRLAHPGLAEQLTPWLSEPGASEARRSAWVLAAGIAEACGVEEVADLVADVVLDEGAPAEVRIYAAYYFRTVARCRPRLRNLAVQGGPNEPARARLELLEVLWPELVPTVELLRCLAPGGTLARGLGEVDYAVHASTIVERFDVADALVALPWVREQAETQSRAFGWSRVVQSVVVRAVALSESPRVFESLAVTLAALPDSLCRELDRGLFETLGPRRLEFALEVLRSGCDARKVGPFGLKLAGPGDLMPLLALHLRRGQPLDGATAELLWSCGDLDDPACVDAIVAHRTELTGNPDFNWLFTRMGTQTSEIMVNLERGRRQAEREATEERARRQPTPLETPPGERVLIRLGQLEAERDPERLLAVWVDLVEQLCLDPEGNRSGSLAHGHVVDMPGWVAADEPTRQQLTAMALRVLKESRLEAECWIGSNRIPLGALGVERAFEVLSLAPIGLEAVSQGVWKAQAGIVVERPFGSSDLPFHAQRRQLLLERAPQATASALAAYLRNSASREAGWTSAADRARQLWSPPIAAVLRNALKSYGAVATNGYAAVVRVLLDHGENPGDDVWARAEGGDATIAGLLLRHEPGAAIDRLSGPMEADPDWGRTVLEAMVDGHHPVDKWPAEVPGEKGLGHLLDLMGRLVPRVHEFELRSGVALGPRGLLHLAWSNIVQVLTDRGTPDALNALESQPGAPWLEVTLSKARERVRAASWQPSSPAEVLEVLYEDRRRVSSDRQLLDLVVHELRAIETQVIRSKPGLLGLLWTGQREELLPRDEAALSDLLANQLQIRMGTAVANREVQIVPRRGGQAGERVDILVQTPSEAQVASLIVEIKGCWNPDLQDVADQLGRYLSDNPGCRAGLVVVGWFDASGWDAKDHRRNRARRQGRRELAPVLEDALATEPRLQDAATAVLWLDLRLGEDLE